MLWQPTRRNLQRGYGARSLYRNTTGKNNTASGSESLYSNTTGNDNTASGINSLYSNTTGGNNNAMGNAALFNNTGGNANNAMGPLSLLQQHNGHWHPPGLSGAVFQHHQGITMSRLAAIAGAFSATGSSNVFIGQLAGANETGSNRLYISNNSTTPLLYGQMSATPAEQQAGNRHWYGACG
ncbi:MAG: hypothetical protein R3E64_17195 [Halioglobus sp.]